MNTTDGSEEKVSLLLLKMPFVICNRESLIFNIQVRTPGCENLKLKVFDRIHRRWRYTALHKLKARARNRPLSSSDEGHNMPTSDFIPQNPAHTSELGLQEPL